MIGIGVEYDVVKEILVVVVVLPPPRAPRPLQYDDEEASLLVTDRAEVDLAGDRDLATRLQ